MPSFFDNFNQSALIALNLAKEEANLLQHDFIDAEHIFLGIIAEGNNVFANFFRDMGVELQNIRDEVEKIVCFSRDISSTDLKFTARARKALHFSNELKDQLNEDSINIELLFGGIIQLIKQGDNILAELLEEFGFNLRNTKKNSTYFNNINSPRNSIESILKDRNNLLIELMKATIESNGNPQAVDALLQDNREQLDEYFMNFLRGWIPDFLSNVRSTDLEEVASNISLLCGYIKGFPFGQKDFNTEIAIKGWEAILQIIKQNNFPKLWASTLSSLGRAYFERVRGKRSDNIDRAIYCFEEATPTLKHFSTKLWALYQNLLGQAYTDKSHGNKFDNLARAIDSFEEASLIFTRNKFPYEWAGIQNGLGNAYLKREKTEDIEKAVYHFQNALDILSNNNFIQELTYIVQVGLGNAYQIRFLGNPVENIELSIRYYRAGLIFFTQDTSPIEWAKIQENLGVSYSKRTLGEQSRNQEQAICCYQNALTIICYDTFPNMWAKTQANLAQVYFERIRGNREDNLEKSISYGRAALKIFTRRAFPDMWAKTNHNLAVVYAKRISGNKVDNLEESIRCSEEALSFFTRKTYPQEWALECSSLAIIYKNRILGNSAENLEKAISHNESALSILTREVFPQQWALVLNNLSNVYRQRIQGNRTKNLNQAIQCCQEALTVFTRDAFPIRFIETQLNLGLAYQEAKIFSKAFTAFASAIDTVELLRGDITFGSSNYDDKQKLAEEWSRLYVSIVEVCLQQSNLILAIEYAERSKNRNLVELILNRDSKSIFPPDVLTQIEQLQKEIAVGQNQLQNGTAENPKSLTRVLQNLRQQHNDLHERYLSVGYGFNLEEFQGNLDKHTTVIEWYITFNGLETFLITHDNIQRLKEYQSANNLNDLKDETIKYLETYHENKAEWENNLTFYLKEFSKILQIEDILNLIPKTCSRLILIPHRYLHLFPLHILPLANGKVLFELFPDGVSYAPSCQLLQLAQQRQSNDFQSLFAIQNPSENLLFADVEVYGILSLFSSYQVLSNKQATKTNLYQAVQKLQQANYLHFACHAGFNQNSPQDSCLELAGAKTNGTLDIRKCLTLGNIFELDFDINPCRLVTLSACETGLIDFNNSSDEYIGLPSGFLYAGCASVICSLWTVDDLSTSFLMIKFYQNLLQNNSVAVALNQAQVWLRDITKIELQKWIIENFNPAVKNILLRHIRQFSDDRPFNEPFYWAAFCAVGQ